MVAAICGNGVDVSLNAYNRVGVERQRAAMQKPDDALAAGPQPPAAQDEGAGSNYARIEEVHGTQA